MLENGEKKERIKYNGMKYLILYGNKLKRGKFAKWNGYEYKLISDMEGNYFILTSDKDKVDDTFVEKNKGYYRKKIDLSSLEYICRYNYFILYEGEELMIWSIKDTNYLIATTDYISALKWGLETIEKGVYGIWMPASEVDVIEEKQEVIYYPD